MKGLIKEFLSTGSVIATIISYVKWHSIGWMLVHSVYGWFYVLYFVCKGY